MYCYIFALCLLLELVFNIQRVQGVIGQFSPRSGGITVFDIKSGSEQALAEKNRFRIINQLEYITARNTRKLFTRHVAFFPLTRASYIAIDMPVLIYGRKVRRRAGGVGDIQLRYYYEAYFKKTAYRRAEVVLMGGIALPTSRVCQNPASGNATFDFVGNIYTGYRYFLFTGYTIVTMDFPLPRRLFRRGYRVGATTALGIRLAKRVPNEGKYVASYFLEFDYEHGSGDHWRLPKTCDFDFTSPYDIVSAGPTMIIVRDSLAFNFSVLVPIFQVIRGPNPKIDLKAFLGVEMRF